MSRSRTGVGNVSTPTRPSASSGTTNSANASCLLIIPPCRRGSGGVDGCDRVLALPVDVVARTYVVGIERPDAIIPQPQFWNVPLADQPLQPRDRRVPLALGLRECIAQRVDVVRDLRAVHGDHVAVVLHVD